MIKINLRNLTREYSSIKNELEKEILSVSRSTNYILGEKLEKFEQNFAKFCGAKYAIGVGSGTAALQLSLNALNIGKGDEVITTAMSFCATAEAIALVGATPVFVDVNEDTLSINPEKIKSAITPRTKAIIPVHLYGVPAALQKLTIICKQNKLHMIEDCAQAHGCFYENKHVGTFGEFGCFSFMPAKNLGGMGDSGCIITNNKKYAEKIRKLRDHGRNNKYQHIILGSNERMDAIQAAILNIKLKYLINWNNKRKNIAEIYNRMLDSNKITFLPNSVINNCVYYIYPIFTKNRSRLKKILEKNNIATGLYYPIPLHLQPVFRYLGYKRGSFPIAEKMAKRILAIPMNPFINRVEVLKIINVINTHV